jgi:hypothetical protein
MTDKCKPDISRHAWRSCLPVAPALAALMVALPAASPPAYAAEVLHNVQVSRLTAGYTSRRGGSGGSPYNLSCSEGYVLIGVNVRSGSLIDRLQGICSRVTSAGNWTGSRVVTGSAGGSGGSASYRLCPSGYAVNGFDGRSGSYLNQLILVCSKLVSSGTIDRSRSVRLQAVGSSGGNAFTTTTSSRPARSIVGKAGAFVDSIQLGTETNSPVISRSQIDAALSGATSVLKTDAGANDVACDVRLQRSGRVRIEPSNGMWNISSSSEINKACDLLGFAVVTNQISYCSGIGSNIIGCARPGCMVVVPFGSGAARNNLWAHEFGHTRALPHRNGSENVMNPVITTAGKINSGECSNYRSPVLSFFFGFLPAEEGGGEQLSLQEFVSRGFVHGVPYEEAVAYGPSAVPELISILRDPQQESNWSVAATMLAMLDDPRGVDAVIEFIEKSNATDPRSERAWARRNAVLSLGYSAGRGNKKTMRYLQESLEPDIWKKRNLRGAQGARPTLVKTEEDDVEISEEVDLDEELTEMAVAGLALTGKPEARKAMDAYARAPGRNARQKTLVAELLPEHAKISSKGIKAYDNERRARAADRAEAAKREAEYRKAMKAQGNKGKPAGDAGFERGSKPPMPDDGDKPGQG